MSRRRLVPLLAGCCLMLPAVAFAQPRARSLSEHDVVQSAVAKNPTLHVALLRASQSRVAVSAEQALYTPTFDARAGYLHSRTPTLTGDGGTRVSSVDSYDLGAGITKPFAFGTVVSASLTGQRASRFTSTDAALAGSSSGPSYALIGQLALTQPLLRGRGDDVGQASLRQAKLALGASELFAQETASSLLSSVVSAYWELWYAGEGVRIFEQSLELARVQEEQAKQQVQSGALAPASALPYATQVAELEEAVLAARTEQRQRELALAQLLGEPREVGVGVVASDSPQPETADDPVEARAVSEALEKSFSRKQLQAQLAIAKDQLKVSGDPLRPRLDVDAYVQAQGLGDRSVPAAMEQFGKLEAVSAHVGLTFETPLSDTRRNAQVQSAQLAAHMTERQLDENELSIRSSVASALTQRRSAREKLTLSTQTERVAQAQADAERARFLAGGSIALLVQQAEDSLRRAQLRVQRARVDLVLADLALAEVRGQLLVRYASAVRALPSPDRTTLTTPHSNF
ncbi:MAG TPA: TolC family protein [Polyangiaceae bacterium]